MPNLTFCQRLFADANHLYFIDFSEKIFAEFNEEIIHYKQYGAEGGT